MPCTVGSNPTAPATTTNILSTMENCRISAVFPGVFSVVALPQTADLRSYWQVLSKVWELFFGGSSLTVFVGKGFGTIAIV